MNYSQRTNRRRINWNIHETNSLTIPRLSSASHRRLSANCCSNAFLQRDSIYDLHHSSFNNELSKIVRDSSRDDFSIFLNLTPTSLTQLLVEPISFTRFHICSLPLARSSSVDFPVGLFVTGIEKSACLKARTDVPASGPLSKRSYKPHEKLKPNAPQFFILATGGECHSE
jgi:hypothetical protein